MVALFRPATRQKSRLRMAIDGVSGSGKTFTALRLALALGKKIAVINTESGAVEKYLGLAPDGTPFQFDVCELSDFSPSKYTESILAAGAAGYDVLIIDSLSHAWAGAGGALELKDRKGGNSFTAWKDITPLHNQMIEAILKSPCHVIATMRSKTEYVLEQDGHGRAIPRKMGMAPVQRAGMEYEFDLYCSIDSEHILRVSKSRCPEVADAITVKPGVAFLAPVVAWLNDGSAASAEKFAVTESDLKKLETAKSADQPPPPKMTTKELVAEAAAKAKEQAAAANAASSETSTANQVDGDSTTAQRERIVALYQLLGVTPEQQASILARRGLSVLRSLNAQQAAEIIGKLEGMLPASNSQEPGSVEAATAGGSSVNVGASSMSTDSPATTQQVAEIKAALLELEQKKPGSTADFIARLNAAGFAKIADMTFDQAVELKQKIDIEDIAAFFDGMLSTAAAG